MGGDVIPQCDLRSAKSKTCPLDGDEQFRRATCLYQSEELSSFAPIKSSYEGNAVACFPSSDPPCCFLITSTACSKSSSSIERDEEDTLSGAGENVRSLAATSNLGCASVSPLWEDSGRCGTSSSRTPSSLLPKHSTKSLPTASGLRAGVCGPARFL